MEDANHSNRIQDSVDDSVSSETIEVVGSSLTTPESFVERQEELIRRSHEVVRDTTRQYVTVQKRRYDLRVRPKKFKVGDWVYYLYPRKRVGRSPKWTRMYTGPYLVVGVLNSLLHRIQRSARSKPILVHVDKLKMVDGDVPRSWLDEQTTSDESEEETLEDLFDDEQPPSIEEEPTRLKRARKLPERFKDFVCQIQSDTGIRGRRRSQEPSEEQHSGSADDKSEYGATPKELPEMFACGVSDDARPDMEHFGAR